MGRAVFANTDRVVGKNVNIGKLSQRAEPNRRAAIVGEDHKRGARCAKKSVIRDAVEDRTHPVLANAKVDIAALGIVAGKILTVLDVVQGRSVEVCAPTHEQRHRLRNRLQCFAARFARRQLRVLRKFRDLG